MELRLEPTILKTLTGANPKLQFLNECLSYSCDERPTVTIMSRRLNQLSMESECLFRMPKTQQVINFSIVLYFKQQIMQVWTSLQGYIYWALPMAIAHGQKYWKLLILTFTKSCEFYSFTRPEKGVRVPEPAADELPVSRSPRCNVTGATESGSSHPAASWMERQTSEGLLERDHGGDGVVSGVHKRFSFWWCVCAYRFSFAYFKWIILHFTWFFKKSPASSGGSDRFTNWATSTAHAFHAFPVPQFLKVGDTAAVAGTRLNQLKTCF